MGVSLLGTSRKASIGKLELDASISESHQATNQVTDHPIEDGAAVTDHVRPQPDVLRLEGVVSNTPVAYKGFKTTETERARTAYDVLRDLVTKREPVDVITTLHDYKDMVLESLEVPRNVRLGEVVRFTAVLKHITKVASASMDIPEPTVDRGSAKANRGKQVAKPVEDTRSMATKLDAKFGNAFTKFVGLR